MHGTAILCSPQRKDGGFAELHLGVHEHRVYHGRRDGGGEVRVWSVDVPKTPGATPLTEQDLPLHLEVRSHSPTGFGWGYGGSGPSQLALALLVDALGDSGLAQEHYQRFKFEHVALWGDTWSISAREIHGFVRTPGSKTVRRNFPGFDPGAVVATANALRTLHTDDVRSALVRHLSGDWGELDRDDWFANEAALRDGDRLFSVYHDRAGTRFYIITEWDRSATTALLPEDY